MKIPKYAKAQATGEDYVRYQAGIRKWWRAIFYPEGDRLRTSRKVFTSAGEAREYKRRVLERLK
jgi:hypothetical protein